MLGVIILVKNVISLLNARAILLAKESSYPRNHEERIIFLPKFNGSMAAPDKSLATNKRG
jgi:hypothetical protein